MTAPSPGARECSVADIPDAELLRRAIRSAKCSRVKSKWVSVMDMFCLGSTYAHQLCRRFGVDPDAKSRHRQDLPTPEAPHD